MNQTVEVEGLCVRLPGFRLQKIDFSVCAGEFFLLLGPTGSGKTLTLEAIAGLVPIHSGVVRVNGRDVTMLPPERREISIVYQDYALFPHMSARENIQYGIRYQGKKRKLSLARITELMDRVGIGHLADRAAPTLSGGEKQRVALVRALAVNPSVLLLDEPLAALDPGYRDEIQQLLKSLHRETGTTFVMVTHDFSEALYLGQRGAVLNNGAIEQQGPVKDMFRNPASPFVAHFAGIKNVFPARFEGHRAILQDMTLEMGRAAPGSAGCVAIRREEIRIETRPVNPDGHNLVSGRVVETIHRGPYVEVWVETGSLVLRSLVTPAVFADVQALPETAVYLSIPQESVLPI